MGYGEIVGGGPAGRYTLSLDYGESTKTATLAALNEQLAKLDVQLAAAQVKLTAAKAAVEEQRIAIADAINVFISAGGTGNLSDTAVQAAMLFLEQQQRAMVEAQKLTIDPQLKVDALRIARAQVLDYIVRWNAAVTQQTKDAWCTDYTEDGAGGVATIDIDGESGLTLIAPGCRGWNESDGYMQHTQLMSPEGYFWNAAALPAWQKWKPTYRWGTISELDTTADTATVALAPASSSAQWLNINQTSTLKNIPVVYMGCNAFAFEEGDRVVVEFQGQEWGSARVIGFLDNPKPCGWTCSGISDGGIVYFKPVSQLVWQSLTASAPVVKYKINGGEWATMSAQSFGPSSYIHTSGNIPGIGYLDEEENRDDARVLLITDPYTPTWHIEYNSIGAAVVPFIPPSSNDADRNVMEFAVYQAGKLVLNAAVTDTGWAGTGIYDTCRVKNPGGIKLAINSVGVTLPLDYVLTAPKFL